VVFSIKDGEISKMKLWQEENKLDKKIEEFTIGRDRELDLILAEFDVLGSIAHTRMLEHVDFLTRKECHQLVKELKKIYSEIKSGVFTMSEGIEDVHSQIEFLVVERLGEIGKKIHTGRSRNDQILLDIRLYIRHEIQTVVTHIQRLFDRLLKLSESNKEILMPGYTHSQVAMPSSFGLWFAAYAESLVDDLIQLEAAFRIVNKNPLGSAAGYGSSLPLDRVFTTNLLGFDGLNYNVLYAQMGRGKTEKVVSTALASTAHTLAKLAADICLYVNENYGFISFPGNLTTGSSIMPHKKNPDAFELIRAKCNKLTALPNEIQFIITNLPSGYHRDFQVLKENFIPAFSVITECMFVTEYMLRKIKINKKILGENKYRYLFSTDAVNNLVREGVPFREAYRQVAQEIEQGTFDYTQRNPSTLEGSIDNLCNDRIRREMKTISAKFNFSKIDKAISDLLR
jgi:argininosuccinate lyase